MTCNVFGGTLNPTLLYYYYSTCLPFCHPLLPSEKDMVGQDVKCFVLSREDAQV